MMRLILTENVKGLGGKGDVVDVADGYGRNYLMPRKLAIKATAGAMKEAERVRAVREEELQRLKSDAEALATTLVGTRVVLAARSADEGKLFGSIGVKDIAEAITKFTGVSVAHEHIDLRSPIKEIGLHEVRIKPHPEVVFPLTLDVIPA
jgi:large subunit ribosomal protein L9